MSNEKFKKEKVECLEIIVNNLDFYVNHLASNPKAWEFIQEHNYCIVYISPLDGNAYNVMFDVDEDERLSFVVWRTDDNEAIEDY